MDPDDQLFGVPRLKEVLTGLTECPLEQVQKCVLESVENFTRGARQADDLTLLVVRFRATAAAASSDTDVPVPSSASSSASAASSGSVPSSGSSATSAQGDIRSADFGLIF
jgi:hypothetical protein